MDLGGSAKTATIYMNGNKLGTFKTGKIDFVDTTTNMSYTTVCADVTSELNGQSHSYSPSMTDPTGSSRVDIAGRIVGTFFAGAVSADQQSGLQLAVWDALYNSTSSFSLDNHKSNSGFSVTGASSGALNWANTYFGAVAGDTGSALYFHTSANGGQSQMTAQAVPEPSALLGLGIMSLGLLRRFKKSK